MKKKEPFYKYSYCDVMTTESDFSPKAFPMGEVKVTPEPVPFDLEIKSSGGTLKCAYDPRPMIAEVSRFFDFMHRPPASYIAEYMEKYNCNEKQAIKEVTAAYKESMEMCLSIACNYIEAKMEEYLYGALWLLLDEAVRRTIILRHGMDFWVKPIGGLLKQIVDEHQQTLRQRLDLSIQGGARWSHHKWTIVEYKMLGELYEQTHPLWKAINSSKKKNSSDWRAEVKKNYPPIPDELLDRLASEDPYESSPAEVALQHAAFLLDIKIGTYTGRQLRTYMKRKPKAGRQKGFRRFKVQV
jgi:hypothetical protein